MLSRKYRSFFEERIRPLSLLLHSQNITATHVTVAGLICSAGAAFAFAGGSFIAGGLLLGIAGLSDGLDGSVARIAGEVTPFGAFIDSVSDRYSELLIFSGLALYYAGKPYLVLVLFSLAGSMMVSYTRAKAESLIGRCDVGFMERPERLILLTAGALFGFMIPALWILAILTNLTAFSRILHTWRMTQPPVKK